MSVFHARVSLPCVGPWLDACKLDRSSASLRRLRDEANLSDPSDKTLDNIAYRDALSKSSTVDNVVKFFDFHKLGVANPDEIVTSDWRIPHLGGAFAAASTKVTNAETDLISEIVVASGMPEAVVRHNLSSRSALPKKACEQIANAACKALQLDRSYLSLAKVSFNEPCAPMTNANDRRELFDALFPHRKP